jgi:hypothetical protein
VAEELEAVSGIEGSPKDVVLSRITIETFLDEDGLHVLRCHAATPTDEDIPLIEVLGMLELAKDTFFKLYQEANPDDT